MGALVRIRKRWRLVVTVCVVAVGALGSGCAAPRVPVLFVHGHSGDSNESWFNTVGGTSFAAALAANPQLPLDAFYLELPVHGSAHPENYGRSITEDAQDILAIIEGGPDSRGAQQVGILNMPAYQRRGRVGIIAYSQGAMSSRYYLKNLMGSRRGGAITVSEFVALAAPNHGAGGVFTCGDASEPDRARRQLCGGRRATTASQLSPCGQCFHAPPALFTTNQPGDDTWITDLNNHPFSESCNAAYSNSDEAPQSRPTRSDGVVYVNLFAAGNADAIVGGATQSGDCLGRRLARSHAPDAANREIAGVPGVLGEVHANFPHHWPTICTALKTVVGHQPPSDPVDPVQVCAGLTPP
ncbi:MAG: lipase family protein [candidate division NC10 bacterium]|nr:lipase family protein [candidate division NC10 bacterium]